MTSQETGFGPILGVRTRVVLRIPPLLHVQVLWRAIDPNREWRFFPVFRTIRVATRCRSSMIPKIICKLLMLLLLVSLNARTDDNEQAMHELDARKALVAQVITSFDTGDYAGLEQLADHLRTTQARFPTGVWKLTVFYQAFDEYAGSDNRDESYWYKLKQRTTEWIEQFPESPTPLVAHGMILDSYAWVTSGASAGQEHPELRDRMLLAKIFLEKNKNIAENDPHWYTLAVRMATVLRWDAERFDKLLEDAFTRYPDYYQTWFAAVEHYSPTWGGDAASVETFARHAIQKTQTIEGFGMYARIYWAVEPHFDAALADTAIQLDDFSRGVNDVLKRYPVRWNVNNFARLACDAQDRELTKALFALMSEGPDQRAWYWTDFERCFRWVNEPPA